MNKNTILSYAWYGLFALVYTLTTLQATLLLFKVNEMAVVKVAQPYLISLVYVFSLAAVLLEFLFSSKSRREVLRFAAKLAVFVLCVILWKQETAGITFTGLLLFAISAHVAEEDKMLKIALWIGIVITVYVFFLSMLGILPNNRGNSFGFPYRTDCSGHLLEMALLWCLLRNGRFSWLGELILVGLTFIMGTVVGGRTDFICLLALTIVTLCRHHLPAFGKLPSVKISAALRYSFIAATFVSFLITLTYLPLQGLWDRIPGLASVKSRLILGTMGLQEFPFTLFGNRINEMGNGWNEGIAAGYFFLDNTYIRLYLVLGAVSLVAFVGLITGALFRLHQSGRHYAVAVLSLVAVQSLLECEAINLVYDAVFLLGCCHLSPKPEEFPKKKLRPVWAVSTALLCVAFGLWCSTAYRISSWRGQAPEYGTTLLLPPSGADSTLHQERLEVARSYLGLHRESAVIVIFDRDKDWLINKGIDQGRVFASHASDENDMLVKAAAIIGENSLPCRPTLCTYYAQQRRYFHRASAMHLPLNGLVVPVSFGQHLRVFTDEQWKILCGKD